MEKMESLEEAVSEIKADMLTLTSKMKELCENNPSHEAPEIFSEQIKGGIQKIMGSHLSEVRGLVREEFSKANHSAPRHSENSDLFLGKIKYAYLHLGLGFLGGLLVTCFVGYALLKPLEKKITARYSLGVMLERVWPNLTEKEKKRLRELF